MTRGPALLPLVIAVACGVSALQSIGAAAFAFSTGPEALHPAETGYGALQMLVFLVAGVASTIWLYQAQHRIRALGATNLSVGPVGQFLWFVVPIATLIMPVKGVSELRKASIAPLDWESVSGSAVLKLWWACWLISGFGNAVSLKASTETAPAFVTVGWWGSTVSDLFGAPAAILFAVLVTTIDAQLRAQEGSKGFAGGQPLRMA